MGMARLTTMAFHGENMVPTALDLLRRAESDPEDAAALLDLATIHLLMGHEEAGDAFQAKALGLQQVYRDQSATADGSGPRLLAFAAPGNLMSNVPIQFLIENSDIQLDLLYVIPGVDLPERVPAHDMAMVVVGESDENREILERIAALVDLWPCPPVLNDPRKVLRLSRDGVSTLLAGAPGIRIPATTRVDPETLARLGRGEITLTELLPDGTYPIIVRPLDSHAGKGLSKLDDSSALDIYMAATPAEAYYLSSFVDYRGAGGLFRKYRIVMIAGHPYVCHMAVSSHWMIHYLNADMRESAEKRAEEAQAFATFDEDFAARHAGAFAAMHERIGLEYFAMDCAETPDGRLLVFEADTAMIVHAMDPPDIFPYKAPQMHRIFRAFQDMLRGIAAAKRA
ncbi:MAG: hypothetical protein HY055_03055 [Magnetospirillum sp.]|nr:hypothetical protein [Magnetospirillum sp.]